MTGVRGIMVPALGIPTAGTITGTIGSKKGSQMIQDDTAGAPLFHPRFASGLWASGKDEQPDQSRKPEKREPGLGGDGPKDTGVDRGGSRRQPVRHEISWGPGSGGFGEFGGGSSNDALFGALDQVVEILFSSAGETTSSQEAVMLWHMLHQVPQEQRPLLLATLLIRLSENDPQKAPKPGNNRGEDNGKSSPDPDGGVSDRGSRGGVSDGYSRGGGSSSWRDGGGYDGDSRSGDGLWP